MDKELFVLDVNLGGSSGDRLAHYTFPGVDKVCFVEFTFDSKSLKHLTNSFTQGLGLAFSTPM